MDNQLVEFREIKASYGLAWEVYYNNCIKLGDILSKEDGFYDFWPAYPGRAGYWDSSVLHCIANKLDELNDPLEKEMDVYFQTHPD